MDPPDVAGKPGIAADVIHQGEYPESPAQGECRAEAPVPGGRGPPGVEPRRVLTGHRGAVSGSQVLAPLAHHVGPDRHLDSPYVPLHDGGAQDVLVEIGARREALDMPLVDAQEQGLDPSHVRDRALVGRQAEPEIEA